MSLVQQSCVPCRGGVAPLGREDADRLLQQTPGWSVTREGTRLERRFSFENFAAALSFVNRIGELAEQERHHPDLQFGWGYVMVVLYTHKIGGLHENDFILAAKISALLQQ